VHELSIAINIVEIASDEVKKAGGIHAEEIVLEIGSLSGVEIDALEFAWQEAVKDSVLKDAKCLIETVPGVAKCLTCNKKFALEYLYGLCPLCNDISKEVEQGKEIRIKSLTII
jgi:hydrogenase nickel incorporation protein HypA/HybF